MLFDYKHIPFALGSRWNISTSLEESTIEGIKKIVIALPIRQRNEMAKRINTKISFKYGLIPIRIYGLGGLYAHDRESEIEEACEMLGVDSKTPWDDIKKAYRKQIWECHPDKNNTTAAEERFKEISVAYAILSNARSQPNSNSGLMSNPKPSPMPGQPVSDSHHPPATPSLLSTNSILFLAP